MNTIDTRTRPFTRTAAARGGQRVRPLRASARRIAAWWRDDAMSAHFSEARERDQRLLRRR
jgi:hypothetical protein